MLSYLLLKESWNVCCPWIAAGKVGLFHFLTTRRLVGVLLVELLQALFQPLDNAWLNK